MHILLVEDSHDDASLLQDFLAEEKDAPQMHWVIDGQEALDYMAAHDHVQKPDIIMMDLALPRLSGMETLQRLKKLPECAEIPVIVLTTSYNPVDENNCKKNGASAFYSKPSDLQGYETLVQHLTKVEFPRLAQAA